MIPPALVYIKVGRSGGLGFWIPVFLLWPLVFAAGVIAVPFVALAELSLRPFGRGKGLLAGTIGLYHLFCAFRHLKVDVRNRTETVSIRIM